MAPKKLDIYDREKKYVQDDPLQGFEAFVTLKKVLPMKVLRMILGCTVLYLQFFNLVGLLVIYNGNSWDDFRKYMASIFIFQPEILGAYLIVKNYNKLNTVENLTRTYCLAPDVLDRSTESKILTACKTIDICMKLFCSITFLFHLAILPVGEECDVFIIFMVVRKYFNAVSPLLHLFYYLSYVVLWFSFTCLVLFIVYTCCHGKFQLYLLGEYLRRISEGFEHIDEYELVHDEEYQETIARRLKLCVGIHINVKRLIKEYYSLDYLPLGYIPVFGSVAIMSSVYFVTQGICPSSNYRMVLVLMCSAIILTISATYGQILINESEKLFHIMLNCPWTNWNTRNRRTFLIMLANSIRPIKISFFNLLDFDVSLIINVTNTSYKLLVLFSNLSNKITN